MQSRDKRLLRYLCLGLFCLAATSTSRAQADANGEIGVHYKRAKAALAVGNSEFAAKEFQAILKIDPNNAQSYANLGVIAYKKGDYGPAKQLFSQALRRNSSLWDAQALLGLSETHLGETTAGVRAMETAFPHIRNPEVKVDAGVAIIKQHQDTRTVGAVVNVVQDLEQTMPDDPEVLYVAYRAYSEIAAEALSALARKAPESGPVYQVYGEASMSQDDFVSAIAQFRKAIAADPTLPGVHYELGLALLTNSQDATARQHAQREFETELMHDKSDFHSEYELGEVFRLGGNLNDAKEHYARALQLRPESDEAQVGLGTVLVEEGQSGESVAHFLEAIRLNPDNEAAHYRLARAYRATGQTEDARKEIVVFESLHQKHESRSRKPSLDAQTQKSDPGHTSVSP